MTKIKKTLLNSQGFNVLSAQDKTRTCTLLTAPAPQAGVSTNSTTWAVFHLQRYKNATIKNNTNALFVPRTGLEPAHHC